MLHFGRLLSDLLAFVRMKRLKIYPIVRVRPSA